MSWTPGWETRSVHSAEGDASELLRQANLTFDTADDADRLALAVDTYRKVLRIDPSNRFALDRMSEASILYGAAYARGRSEKAEWYRSGIRAAESSLATNEAFRRRVESGETVAEAVDELGRGEMRPMLLWVTGVSYYFKECLTGISKLVHFRWMLRTREVMNRMLEVDPEFENGAVLFSLAIYHIGAPPGAGRDMPAAAEYFERAIEYGPDSLLIPWGRAKYYHSRLGDTEAARKDLEWVLSQNPKTASSPYAWNVYFQSDARRMLLEIDEQIR